MRKFKKSEMLPMWVCPFQKMMVWQSQDETVGNPLVDVLTKAGAKNVHFYLLRSCDSDINRFLWGDDFSRDTMGIGLGFMFM